MLDCENYITYKKVDPSEVIEVGDVIMIDPDNGYITRAVRGDNHEFPINTRMVVAICIWSNNTALPTIIIDGGPSKDLDRKEKFWISFFNSDKVEKGYNLTSGGQGGAFLSKEDTKKARDIFIEKYGKKYNIKRKGQNIRCIETQKIFKNAAEASRVMKIHHGHITSAANGKLKTAGGYHWEWCLELSFFPNALYCQELDKIFLSFYEAQRENNFSNVKLGRKFKESKKISTYAGYTFEKINYQE